MSSGGAKLEDGSKGNEDDAATAATDFVWVTKNGCGKDLDGCIGGLLRDAPDISKRSTKEALLALVGLAAISKHLSRSMTLDFSHGNTW